MIFEDLLLLYEKIQNGEATSFERAMFEIEIKKRSWKREYIIKKLEEALRKRIN